MHFAAKKTILRWDPDFPPDEGDGVEFRLTYEGELRSSQGDARDGQRDRKADHKHAIRREFHKQLKAFWEINPYLRHGYPVEFDWKSTSNPKRAVSHHTTLTEWLAERYTRNGYRFVPLVRRDLELVCALEVLVLRPEPPGHVLQSGDLDNRLKTLFDALKMPRDLVELGSAVAPGLDEDPFFCLLEDDSVITHASIETDVLLAPVSSNSSPNDVRLMIKVKLRPYNASPANQGFG